MNPEDVEKLLGGYATGSLSAEERRILFEAAVHDQKLFDALVEEQALKEALEAPGARARLLEAARNRHVPARSRWWRPWAWPAAAAVALAAVTIFLFVHIPAPVRAPDAQVARLEKKSANTVPAPPAQHSEERTRRGAPLQSSQKQAAVALRRARVSEERTGRGVPPRSRSQPAAGVAGAAGAEPALAARVPAAEPAPVEFNTRTGSVLPRPSATPKMAAARSFGALMTASLVQPELAVSVRKDGSPPAAVFLAGDTVQLHMTPPFNGNLYVLRSGDGGATWGLVWSAAVPAAAEQTAPLNLPAAGETKLIVVLSRAPMPELLARPPLRPPTAPDRIVREIDLTVR
ncbi:MAG: hypothetical protein ABI165_07880 [Bryobacteraceae bacterium]